MSDETENLSTAGVLPERVTGETSSTPAVETPSATHPPPTKTPHEFTRTEAIVELCKLGFGADDRQRLAILKAVKALGREITHKANYARNKSSCGESSPPPVAVTEPAMETPAE